MQVLGAGTVGLPRPPAGVHGWWALHPTVPAWVWGPQHRHPAETTDFSWCGQALQPGHRGSEKAHPLCPELSKTGTPLPGLQEPLPASQLGTVEFGGGGRCRDQPFALSLRPRPDSSAAVAPSAGRVGPDVYRRIPAALRCAAAASSPGCTPGRSRLRRVFPACLSPPPTGV